MSDSIDFTPPQVIRNVKVSSSIFYDWLEVFSKRGLIEKKGEKPSSGAIGKTEIFKITEKGKIFTAFLTGKMAYLDQGLLDIKNKENNKVKCFSVDAFLKIDNDIKSHVLEGSLKEAAWLTGNADLGNLLSEGLLQAVTEAAFSDDPKMLKFARENMDLVENQQSRAAFFLLRNEIESHFLTELTRDKLDKYVESLETNCKGVHVPCGNPECNNVIILDKLTDLPTDPKTEIFCKKCK